jgi:hypothetical protein
VLFIQHYKVNNKMCKMIKIISFMLVIQACSFMGKEPFSFSNKKVLTFYKAINDCTSNCKGLYSIRQQKNGSFIINGDSSMQVQYDSSIMGKESLDNLTKIMSDNGFIGYLQSNGNAFLWIDGFMGIWGYCIGVDIKEHEKNKVISSYDNSTIIKIYRVDSVDVNCFEFSGENLK